MFRHRKHAKFRCYLMPPAVDVIRRELRKDVETGFYSGENGGFLLGRPGTHTAVALDATGAGPAAARQAESIELDSFYGGQIAAQRGLEIVGCWHVHPGNGDEDVSELSDGDLRTAARHLKSLSRDRRQIGWTLTESIVSAHPLDQWTAPTLTGWTFALGVTDWDPVFVEETIVDPGAVKL